MIDLSNVRVADRTGKPIKNKLPEELQNKFFTEKQWADKGYQIKEGAEGYEMHQNAMYYNLKTYYYIDDVEPLSHDKEICANCAFRYMEQGRCIVMGEFKSGTHHCSEWASKYGKERDT